MKIRILEEEVWQQILKDGEGRLEQEGRISTQATEKKRPRGTTENRRGTWMRGTI